jgi:hypothetical protein
MRSTFNSHWYSSCGGRWLPIVFVSLALLAACSDCAIADDAAGFESSAAADSLTPFADNGSNGLQTLTAQLLSDPPAQPPSAVAADYWIVSSRRTVQHRLHRGQIELDYFSADAQGNLTPADAFTLNASLIPGVPVCIFVHGSFVEWNSTTEENVATNRWIRGAAPHQPLQIIFYSWPSDGPYLFGGPSPLDVGIRGMQAEFNGLHLAHLLSVIPEDCPVCLVGHSHGARAVSSAMHLIGGGAVQGYALRGMPPHRYSVVYAAAAIDHHWLNPGQHFDKALCPPECVLNLRNRADLPLRFYCLHRPFSGSALATSGFTSWDRYQLGPLGAKLADTDVTDLLGDGHVWPCYINRPEIAAMIAPYVFFQVE